MKIKEFFESEEKLAIHCDSEKKAEALVEAFDREGYTWYGGYKYTDDNCWYCYMEETCYDNKRRYCNRKHYKDNRCKILEFEDIEDVKDIEDIDLEQDLSQYTIDELLEEIKRRIKE